MIRAWHFVGKRLRDGRPIPKDGEWLVCEQPLVICRTGLHASREPFDALQYAPGDTLCLVDCDGKVIEQSDKLVCARRRIVARMDATELCSYFARMQALAVVHLWDATDVVLDYLMTGDHAAYAAYAARAVDAAYDAAYAARAAYAAYAARAVDAAYDAAYGAAAYAAYAACDAAARAAYAAARAVDAAYGAAAYAARAAYAAAARADFYALVSECFEGVA